MKNSLLYLVSLWDIKEHGVTRCRSTWLGLSCCSYELKAVEQLEKHFLAAEGLRWAIAWSVQWSIEEFKVFKGRWKLQTLHPMERDVSLRMLCSKTLQSSVFVECSGIGRL